MKGALAASAAAVSLAAAADVQAQEAQQARMLVTAYCLQGVTATGTYVHPGTVAVDPKVIPLGSKVWVEGYGPGVAEDTGGAVRGWHVDVWMPSCAAAMRSTHYGVVKWSYGR